MQAIGKEKRKFHIRNKPNKILVSSHEKKLKFAIVKIIVCLHEHLNKNKSFQNQSVKKASP